MRILYIDIDTLRPDHLGCYGYHRNTSPNIDRIAREGVRFENCYASDTPCLPSRASLFTGRFGIHNGAIAHGGTAADPFVEGRNRGFRDSIYATCWMTSLRNAGLKTVTVSPFGERHASWFWYAGFNEIYNPGKGGMESAEEVTPTALDWIQRNAKNDNWFLHVHTWDPHTPYRAPASYGNPFAKDPLPAWYTEEIRQQHWTGCGPHSAQEVPGFTDEVWFGDKYPRQPARADTMDAARRMFDGYDTGVRYADEHFGYLLKGLEEAGVLNDTAIIISSDHGEALGELNIYGDHQLADHITNRVPLIIRWPGVTDAQAGRADTALHYANDMAATVTELAGGKVPENWDGEAFTPAFRVGKEEGRNFLVLSHAPWSCQRAARFTHQGGEYVCLHSYHDGYHGLPDVLLFDVKNDPHEQHDLTAQKPDLAAKGLAMIEAWHREMMRTATQNVDPMWTVLREGGPFHCRGALPKYLERLRATGRAAWADHLERKHPREAKP